MRLQLRQVRCLGFSKFLMTHCSEPGAELSWLCRLPSLL